MNPQSVQYVASGFRKLLGYTTLLRKSEAMNGNEEKVT